MRFLLLLGAGFSRNWGGWLAPEAFEYLLGTDQIANNPSYRQLLWKHYDTGGFERALAEIQADFRRDPDTNRARLEVFQFAIQQMFGDMNRRFNTGAGGPAWDQLKLFLDRFDAICTLNQDLLLELWYSHTVGREPRHRKWLGASLPGLMRSAFDPNIGGQHWAKQYDLDAVTSIAIDPDYQPYFKLHGSTNWLQKGRQLLVIGGQKSEEINRTPLLRTYFEMIEGLLSSSETRLMVIGYGFRDDHVNSMLERAANRGMRMFVVDPAGSSLARGINPIRTTGTIVTKSPVEELFETSLIGSSRRLITDIFSKRDMIEYDKLERFFRH